MNTLRLLLRLAMLAFLVSQTTACQKRKPDAKAGPAASSEAGKAAGAPLVVDPPRNLPPQSIPLPRPPAKPWSERTRQEKLVQIDYWLNQHQFGDAAQKAKVAGEIRAAGLSPDDEKDLDDTRKRFGYRPISP